jgi:hypothetical protein
LVLPFSLTWFLPLALFLILDFFGIWVSKGSKAEAGCWESAALFVILKAIYCKCEALSSSPRWGLNSKCLILEQQLHNHMMYPFYFMCFKDESVYNKGTGLLSHDKARAHKV